MRLLPLLVFGGAALAMSMPALQAAEKPACTEYGVASFYGPGFDGNPTASGEIFDAMAMTAAHPTLPLGTEVAVTHEASGKTVEVTVNDRGPYVDGRIIDLSVGAAEALDMIEEGLAEVTVEVFADDQTDPDIRETLAEQEPAPYREMQPCPVAEVAAID